MIADLGSSGGEKIPLPLPVTREDFQRGLDGVTGVELRSFTRSENEKDITIHAELSFNRIESLAQVAAFQDSAPIQSVAGSTHTITQMIAKAQAVEPTQDSLDMLDAFFSGYAISMTVVAPAPIHSHSLGDLSADKKTLTYSAPIKDLVTAKADVILTLSW
jgi:hypothetical protein